MADIRQNTVVLDDFDRADENPLSFGGKWSKPSWVSDPLQVISNKAAGQGPTSHSYWNSLSMDGDDAECWAFPYAGNSPSIAWGIGLYAGSNGYLFRSEVSTGGGTWSFYKLTGGSFTSVATLGPFDAPPHDTLTGGNGGPVLIRRNGNDVEGWYDPSGTGTGLNLILAITDTSYTTGLYGALELFSTLNGWDDFGAGPEIITRTQIYRWVSN